MPSVFVSAVSRDLRSYRNVVTNWARLRGYDVVVQDEFPVMSDYGTIVHLLRDKLAPCDAVIHLAGLCYGFEPTNRPDGENRRSYTQLEYELGKEHKRQVFRFIARENYQADMALDEIQAQLQRVDPNFSAANFAEQCRLQIQHRERLKKGSEQFSATSRATGNELFYEFSTPQELRELLDKIEIRATVAKPTNLPFASLGSLFKGRDEFLNQLRRVLINKPTHIAAVTAKQAIHGLGGVGKTRAAIEYGYRYEHEYTAMLFVTADSPANLERNLASLCGAMVLNLPEKDAKEQSTQVAAAVRWLREHSGWFLIFDNADTPEAAVAVEAFAKDLPTGHVVITSRLADWQSGVEALSLDVLNETSAIEFLLERTDGKRQSSSTDPEDAEALVRDLDGLALALEQAGAFISNHHNRIADYRERWKQQERKVFEWFDERTMKYPKSVAVTWQTSVERLSEDGRRLLNLLCWLAPDPMPRAIIDKAKDTGGGLFRFDGNMVFFWHLLRRIAWRSDCERLIDVEAGAAELTLYSLAKRNVDCDSLTIHRLVGEVTCFRVASAERDCWLSRARWMMLSYIRDPGEPSNIQGCRNHLLSVTEHEGGSRWSRSASLLILNAVGERLCELAEFQHAEQVHRRAVAIAETTLGPEHAFVAMSLKVLADVLRGKNQLSDAEILYRRALAILEIGASSAKSFKALSFFFVPHTDPIASVCDTIEIREILVSTCVANLALVLYETKQLAEAEAFFLRALGRLGSEDSASVAVLNNWAILLGTTGRLSEAEAVLRRAMPIAEKNKRADLATTLNNLAWVLCETNRLVEAQPVLQRALAVFQAEFGDEHPKTKTVQREYDKLLRDIATNERN